MNAEEYFDIMRETSAVIMARARQLVSWWRPYVEEGVCDLCDELLARRERQAVVTRGCIARFVYEATGGDDWTKILDFCAMVEIELASMYYANRALDGKGGFTGDPRSQLIASMLTHEMVTMQFYRRAIDEKWDTDYLRYWLSMLTLRFFEGEYLDMKVLNLAEEPDAWGVYTRRCQLINANFFEQICHIAYWFANRSLWGFLDEFGRNYGMALQVLNDIADFVPPSHGLGTAEKLPTDAWSDIRLGKLTAPTLFALENGSAECRELVAGAGTLDQAGLERLTQLLVQEGHMARAKAMVHGYASQARKELRVLPKERRRMLSGMCVIFDSNRYYKALDM